jgi:hypothetical protein
VEVEGKRTTYTKSNIELFFRNVRNRKLPNGYRIISIMQESEVIIGGHKI